MSLSEKNLFDFFRRAFRIKDNSKNKSNESENNSANIGGPFVRSLSQYHRGKIYPVTEKPLIIGRNESLCDLLYDNGVPGVSKVHCSVSYDGEENEFILTDLGSTYGTYLKDGRKIPQNTPIRLKPFNCFYVGDKSNVCRVEVSN